MTMKKLRWLSFHSVDVHHVENNHRYDYFSHVKFHAMNLQHVVVLLEFHKLKIVCFNVRERKRCIKENDIKQASKRSNLDHVGINK